MNIHRNLIPPVFDALKRIFADGEFADKVVAQTLKSQPKWGVRDRRFVAESVYDIVRWWRLLWEIRGGAPVLDAAPLWDILGIHLVLKGGPLPDWPEWSGLEADRVRRRHAELQAVRGIRESIPDWLDELGARELGDRWAAELGALNRPAEVVLRVNTLKTTRDELQGILKAQDIGTHTLEWAADALVLDARRNAYVTQAFRDGLFEVQDACSQLVAPFLGVEPGMRVVDACAGGGGKTLHLAALMQNRGKIIALDVEEWKLRELKRRARRASVSNIETRVADSSKVIKRLRGRADGLLLDAPCSGLGVLRRNPDAKWKLSPEVMERLRGQQGVILDEYADIVRPGGGVVYATCSLLPSENGEQVRAFLDRHAGRYSLVEEKTVYPSESGFDGFYMALLRRVT